jgi:hypothetical protein
MPELDGIRQFSFEEEPQPVMIGLEYELPAYRK